MAVIILTDNSFLLNRPGSRALFPFEKNLQRHGFDHAPWRLFVCTPGKQVRKAVPGSRMIGDAQDNEFIGGIKPVHAPAPHQTGPHSYARAGVVVTFKSTGD